MTTLTGRQKDNVSEAWNKRGIEKDPYPDTKAGPTYGSKEAPLNKADKIFTEIHRLQGEMSAGSEKIPGGISGVKITEESLEKITKAVEVGIANTNTEIRGLGNSPTDKAMKMLLNTDNRNRQKVLTHLKDAEVERKKVLARTEDGEEQKAGEFVTRTYGGAAPPPGPGGTVGGPPSFLTRPPTPPRPPVPPPGP